MKLFDKSARLRQVGQLLLPLIVAPGLFYHNALTANNSKDLRQSSNSSRHIDQLIPCKDMSQAAQLLWQCRVSRENNNKSFK